MRGALFVYPEYRNNRFVGFAPHYGCGSIVAYLRQHGIAADQFLGPKSTTVRDAAAALAARRPRVLGVSCYDASFYLVRLIVREFRRLAPDAVIVLGGPSATFAWRVILDHCPEVDACAVGDGEEVALTLLQTETLDRGSLPRIPGLATRDLDPVDTEPHRARDINEYPSAYLAGTVPALAAPNIGLLSTRGCFHRCSFCNFAALSGFRVRFYAVERLIAEIGRIAAAPWSRRPVIPFYDDFFTAHRPRVHQICDAIRRERLDQRLIFSCETRADSVDRDLLATLWSAGFRVISFGIESGSPAVLKEIRKVRLGRAIDAPGCEPEETFLERVRASVRIAKELGFRVTGSIILGLPGETDETGRQTLDFVRSLGLDAYSHNYLSVFPGTELFTTHRRYGIRVTPSATMLPFTTRASYDVAGLSYLRDIADVGIVRRTEDVVRRILEIRGRGTAASDSGDVLYLRKNTPGPVRHGYWTRVATTTRPDTMFVLEQSGVRPEWCAATYAGVVASELPILEQNLVMADGRGFDVRICSRGEWTPATDVFSVRVAVQPFRQWMDSPLDQAVRSTIWTLDEPHDLARFAREAARYREEGVYALAEGCVPANGCIDRLCRFGLGCPVRSGTGAYVDEDGRAQAVCGMGALDGPCDMQAVDRARGCTSCPASDSCSRCPAPGPMSAAAYCDLMRRTPGIQDYARLLDCLFQRWPFGARRDPQAGRDVMFKSFASPGRPIFYGGETRVMSDRLAAHVQPNALLVAYRGMPVIYRGDTRELVELSVPLAEVAEAVHAGVGFSSMATHFSQRYGLSLHEAGDKVREAISMLNSYQLVDVADAVPAEREARHAP